jgi:pyrroloquinoline quinone (PQQ) biosynthesis protein C
MTHPWRVTLDELHEALTEPLGTVDPGKDALERAVADSIALAQAAYKQADPAARLFAERVLHVIQVRSHFAPPMQGVPAIYWNVLIRAKLATELRPPSDWPDLTAGIDRLETTELKRRLEDAVARFGCHNHDFLDDVADRSGDRALRIFAKNWYGSCQGFSHQLIQMVQRTTGAVRRSVSDNVADEFSGVGHDELRMRFIESVGFRYDAQVAATDPERVVESYALMSYRTGICVIQDTMFALGSFYTTEANWPLECKRMLVGLRGRGCTDHDLEYWSEHAHADEDHAAEWLEVLLEAARTPALRERVLTGALAQLHLRRRMYDSMRALARTAS